MKLSKIERKPYLSTIRKILFIEDASKIVKDISKPKFDPTVDIAVRLGWIQKS